MNGVTDKLAAPPEPTTLILWILLGLVLVGFAIKVIPWWMKSSLSLAALGTGMAGLVVAAKHTSQHVPPQTQSLVWLLVAICGFVASLRASKILLNPHQVQPPEPDQKTA